MCEIVVTGRESAPGSARTRVRVRRTKRREAERDAFGDYAPDPLSVFMEKRVNT